MTTLYDMSMTSKRPNLAWFPYGWNTYVGGVGWIYLEYVELLSEKIRKEFLVNKAFPEWWTNEEKLRRMIIYLNQFYANNCSFKTREMCICNFEASWVTDRIAELSVEFSFSTKKSSSLIDAILLAMLIKKKTCVNFEESKVNVWMCFNAWKSVRKPFACRHTAHAESLVN